MKNTKNKGIIEVEIFPNPFPERDYTIDMECPEFTCLCPKTGQPDFATLYISYVPDKFCIELKALKIYLTSYRNEGGFHEKVVNIILDDLVSACKPRKMTIIGDFNVRGGIHTTVTVEHSGKKTKAAKRKK
ncbi:MAG: NADPH-dependent 7-cyano-7-deazaguanine reductase QueF [Nitrospina sp.]|jgi:7-cyano-7-deazaguanine reductase|nr:NADPH-dependent 7-cyano-7-deazaguanine reductase QueF [Nitrospina sp.]MBT6716924.1 NADPH-dependent 7-cyano-7-deazaguanine reductase QueF [Nitrospina sp.]